MSKSKKSHAVPAALRRPSWLTGVAWISAAVLGMLSVGPALWLLLVALQPADADLLSLSFRFTLENFRGAWEEGGLGGPLLNSVLVTFFRASLNVLMAALAAYPLARLRFRGKGLIFVTILATMMIPEQVIVVPMFQTVVSLGLFDTLVGVVLPGSVTAFGIYLCKQAFEQIPMSVEEAARIDGANALQIWWHVMLPLAGPTLATLALFSAIGAWSDLLWPLIVLQTREQYTLPVAINELLGVFATNVRYAYAASVLALVPILVFFLVSQKLFKPEMFGGAVKG